MENFRRAIFYFFMMVGLNSSSCISRSMFQILKTCFTKKAQDIVFLNIEETDQNRPKMQTFVKHVFKI